MRQNCSICICICATKYITRRYTDSPAIKAKEADEKYVIAVKLMYLDYVYISFGVLLAALCFLSTDCTWSNCVLFDNKVRLCACSVTGALGIFPKAEELQTHWPTEVSLHHILWSQEDSLTAWRLKQRQWAARTQLEHEERCQRPVWMKSQ